jgi:allantoicase
MSDLAAASFTGLVDLAAEALGGRALSASDEFFASKDNLLKEGRGVFVPGKYTDRGKWMDGWESRRKRVLGHDHCIIALGAPGHVLGLDIDTNHFLGNHPPFASVEGLWAEPDVPLSELERMPFRELLAQVPLRPGSQNLFAAERGEPVTHVRLNIFPDGGVARFRVYGKVMPGRAQPPSDAETLAHAAPSLIDLAALRNGALALACSDAFFGPMNNLLLPGRAADMGGGWETRRKRAPGYDWILIKLAERGRISVLELDTNHFKGNFPDRASVEVIDAPDARITDLNASRTFVPLLPETKLGADRRHFFGGELVPHPPATHLRLNIFPDGGVSRLRAWGTRE